MDESVTIKEAAVQLGVSAKTVRRWITTGKLHAELVNGAYGQEYRVARESLQTATQVLDVVRVERPTDPMTLALAVAKALEEAQRPVYEELRNMREELTRHREAVEALTQTVEALKPASPEVAPEVAPENRHLPWFLRWIGQGASGGG